jgi:hypothetical protein
MYAVSETLQPVIDELGLGDKLKELERDGYTVLHDVAPPETHARVRAAVLRCVDETEGPLHGAAASLLLGRDPVFTEVVLNPKVLAIAEFLCGQGALLSQLAGTVRGQGAPALALHADYSWAPAPLPEHNQLATFCWTTDDFTRNGGATKVVPGTHRLRRHPSTEEITAEEGAIAIECPAGSVAVWDSSVWHGNYERTLPGERVVVHATYGRVALRPIDDWSHLSDEWVAQHPKKLMQLLGRSDFFGTSTVARGSSDMEKFFRTMVAARG